MKFQFSKKPYPREEMRKKVREKTNLFSKMDALSWIGTNPKEDFSQKAKEIMDEFNRLWTTTRPTYYPPHSDRNLGLNRVNFEPYTNMMNLSLIDPLVASLEKKAQEDLPDINIETPLADEPPTPEEAPRALKKLLEAPATETGDESPEAFFKSVSEDLPEIVRKMSDFDRMYYYLLEKERVKALNSMSKARLTLINSLIEDLLEKYVNPIPEPSQPILDTSHYSASKKTASFMEEQKKRVDELAKQVLEACLTVKLPIKYVGVASNNEDSIEFLVRASLKTSIREEPFDFPLIVKVEKKSGKLDNKLYTLYGKAYSFDEAGVKKLYEDLSLSNIELVY